MARVLQRHRHVVVVSLLLAVGIGAAASVLSIRRALSPLGLPFPHADRLVMLQAGGRSWSPGMLEALAGSTTAFDSAVGIQERAAALAGVNAAEVLRLESVSVGYFELLGVAPARGRLFSKAEDSRNGSAAVAIISDALWQRRFASTDGVLRQQISIDGQRLDVIGVMPRGFRGLIGRADVWVPLGSARWLSGDTAPERPTSRWFEVLARRRPELAQEEAQARYATEARAAISRIPGADGIISPATRFALIPLAHARVPGMFRQAAGVLTVAVTVLLGLVIANVLGLQLLHTDERTRELAVRLAVGASLRHIGALALREAGAVAVLSAAGALLLRPVCLSALAAVQPPSTGFGVVTSTVLTNAAFKTDAATLLAVAGMAVLGALPLVVGTVLKSRRLLLDPVLRDRIAQRPSDARALTSRTLLVAAQAAVACAVVCCGMLLARSSAAVFGRDRGYEIGGVVMARMDLPAGYDGAKAAIFYQRVVERLTMSPGVTLASVSNCAPGAGRCRRTNVNRVDDRSLDPAAQPTIGLHYVTPDHFAVLGARISRGRTIASSDRAGAPNVVVISEPLAARLWPSADPIGRTLEVFTANGSLNGSRTVVGTVHRISFDVDADGGLDVFLPATQAAWSTAIVFAKGRASRQVLAQALVQAVASLDRDVPLYDAGGLEAPLERSLGVESFLRRTLLAFGLAGLLLAGFGTYAIVSQAAGRTRRELGIRIALGATPRQVGLLVARRGLVVAMIATSAGSVGAIWASGLLTAFLHGLSRIDPVAITAGPALTIFAIGAATWRPAAKAARANPVVALKIQ